MNRVAQPVGPNEEGLDALLGAFFRAEMPSPWPAFLPPRARTLPFRPAASRPHKRRGLALASRVALVAAVALLLLAAWLMPRGPAAVTLPGPMKLGPGEAPRPSGKELHVPNLNGVAPPGAGNVKSSLQLEQKDGRGAIRIDVMEIPPGNK